MKFWGVKSSEIITLTDAMATKERFNRLLKEWVIRGARAGDRIVLSFSGHGWKVGAADSTVTHTRSALVPWNFRKRPNGAFETRSLITGDVIRRSLAELHSAGVTDVTVLIDACCAAGATRRAGEPSTYIVNPELGLAQTSAGGPTFREPGDDTESYVVISASAYDRSGRQGPAGGYLTGGVIHAVEKYYALHGNAARPMSYRDLNDWLSVEMADEPDKGIPSEWYMTGMLDRPLFASGTSASDPYFLVTLRGSGLRMEGGSLLGVEAGDTAAIFQANTPHFGSGKPLAMAQVIGVRLYDSDLRIIGHSPDRGSLQAARAVLRSGRSASAQGRYDWAIKLNAPDTIADLKIEREPARVENGVAEIDPPNRRDINGYALRIRALGPNGEKRPRLSVYTAVLSATGSRVRVLWPRTERSSERTRTLAQGEWCWLGFDGALTLGGPGARFAGWRYSDEKGPTALLRVIGTSKPRDFTPFAANLGTGVSAALWAKPRRASPKKPQRPTGDPPGIAPDGFAVAEKLLTFPGPNKAPL
jgi:hypothetical protein